MNKIILLGYMGSGKSVVAALLAERLHFKHIDLDSSIEAKTNSSINGIFEKRGEVFFRKIEHQTLAEIINSDIKMVLSLGGGTPCYSNNNQLLKNPDVISFYLKASIYVLAQRLATEKKERPLISSLAPDDMKEFIAKHLFERSFYYNQATHIITVDGKSPEAIASEIQDFLI